MPNGLLLIDKPLGTRSTDVVAQVKRKWGRKVRVGHAGTLDSTASGLLIILLGTATRLSDYVMKLPKVYEAEIQLGEATDSCDYSGVTIFRGDASKVSQEAFDRVLCSFRGTRFQRPPEISALKIGGTPSHRLARSGKEMENKPLPRLVEITRLDRISPLREGKVKISILCGKGTYIRSIARDIGEILRCGAHITALRRLSIGPFGVQESKPDILLQNRDLAKSFHRILLNEKSEEHLINGISVLLREAGAYVPGTVELTKGLCVEGRNMMGFAELLKSSAGLLLKPKANILDKGEHSN